MKIIRLKPLSHGETILSRAFREIVTLTKIDARTLRKLLRSAKLFMAIELSIKGTYWKIIHCY